MTDPLYCSLCPYAAPDGAALQEHYDAEHPNLAAWLTEGLGAAPLALGAAVWYWNQDQDPARDGWQPATVAGWGGKDGYPVYDVTLANGWVKWGWAWQVIPRGAGDLAPTDPPGATRGAAGPWP